MEEETKDPKDAEAKESIVEYIVRTKGLNPQNPEDLEKIIKSSLEAEKKIHLQGQQLGSFKSEITNLRSELETLKKERENSFLTPQETEEQRLARREQLRTALNEEPEKVLQSVILTAEERANKRFDDFIKKRKEDDDITAQAEDYDNAVNLLPGVTREEKENHLTLVNDEIEKIMQERNLVGVKGGMTTAVEIYTLRQGRSTIPAIDTTRTLSTVKKGQLTSADLEKMSKEERSKIPDSVLDEIVARENK